LNIEGGVSPSVLEEGYYDVTESGLEVKVFYVEDAIINVVSPSLDLAGNILPSWIFVIPCTNVVSVIAEGIFELVEIVLFALFVLDIEGLH
jgi:hypothetical protein